MSRKNDRNKGFTLVELIVVLVILAILAAILVPALLGYIDRAKNSQYILEAKSTLTATQAELAEMYARDAVMGSSASLVGGNPYGDVNWIGTSEAKRILATADANPYMLIVGMGKYDTYKDVDLHKAYTAYFVAYWPAEDVDPIFFDGTTWTTEYPWKASGANTFEVNGHKIEMQFYFLTGPSNNLSNNWNKLKKYLGVK